MKLKKKKPNKKKLVETKVYERKIRKYVKREENEEKKTLKLHLNWNQRCFFGLI